MNSSTQRITSVFRMIAVISLFIGALICSSPSNASSRETSSTGFNINQTVATQVAYYYRYHYYRPYYRYHYYRPYYWGYHPRYYNRYYYRGW